MLSGGTQTVKARPVVRARMTATPCGQNGTRVEAAKRFPLIDGYSLDGFSEPEPIEPPKIEEPPAPKPEPPALEAREGLLRYKKWWFTREVDIAVGGKLLTGTPIFAHENTLHVVGENHSYFIPLKNIDYIRTPDGLNACQELDG